MSIKKIRKIRLRRAPEAARENILNAAEKLLLDAGPLALKLSDTAAAAGVANASVLHHFGSIDGLHAALMERMAAQLIAEVNAIGDESADRSQKQAAVFQALFDVFERRGAARLAAWLELTGEWRRMDHIREAVRGVVARRTTMGDVSPAQAEDLVLMSLALAMGVGLFGQSLADLLNLPPARARLAATDMLRAFHAAQRGDA